MKFVRYGDRGAELPGLIDAAGRIRALSPLLKDITVDMFTPEWRSALAAIDPQKLPVVGGTPRLGVPIAGIRQIIGIGLNYRDHAEESNVEVPEYPLVFAKSIASLSGCADPIAVPAGADQLDWEIELGFLVGQEARHVPVEKALDYVAGYCAVIDVSERCWQLKRGGQFGKGKSYDGFTPVGPWLVTSNEVADPQALDLWLDVNGVSRQRGTTSEMIFSVAEIVAHLSTYQTLLPGDFVVTGTPGGVGLGMKPPVYLRPADELRCGVTGLGDQHHVVKLQG
jgi:2-keto-4-pentenoate hydratase/2-oxohepta-3-ene-1,7-dioic acid hydratase in catechol pathway